MKNTQLITSTRRTEYKDWSKIKELLKPQTLDLFGDVNIFHLIEFSYLSLTQEDCEGNIVSFVALFDYPNVPALPSDDWLVWLKHHYKLDRVSPRNTLFIHLLVWDSKHTYEFLRPLLQSLFQECTYLHNIMITVPPKVKTFDIFDEYFTHLLPLGGKDFSRIQTILLCVRQRYLKKMKIRHAREEDHDDLMPLFDRSACRLREQFGEFFISELISSADEKRHILVAEVRNRVVGMLSLSSNVNYTLLNRHFELVPFYGLRQPDERDKIPLPAVCRTDSLESVHLTDSELTIYSDISELSVVLEDLEESNQSTEEEELKESPSDDLVIVNDPTSTMFEKVFEQVSSVSDLGQPDKEEHISSENSIINKIRNTAMNMLANSAPPEIKTKTDMKILPSYHGLPNTFLVELFMMGPDQDDRLSVDFLEAAFECYPEMEYCVISLPCSYPVYPTLQHFVMVTPRSGSSFEHELYLVHRNSVLSELIVRPATHLDLIPVNLLLGRIMRHDQVLIDLKVSVTHVNSLFKSYVFTTEECVVGVAIISVEEDMEYVRSHYRIEDYTRYKLHARDQHGVIKHLILSPIFENDARYLLKELHRQSNLTSLYYPLYKGDAGIEEHASVGHSVATVLSQMIPVLPRPQPEYTLKKLGENKPNLSVLGTEMPFALYYMNKRYSSVPKIAINTKIIIVGASNAELGFLEQLLFGPSCVRLTFNNLTLVCPHGMPGDLDHPGLHNQFLPQTCHFSAQYMAKISLHTWVNIVPGHLTAINRKVKQIIINNESVLPYEYLLLFGGETFQKVDTSYTVLTPGERKTVAVADSPHNVFYINCESDAFNALLAVKSIMRRQKTYNIVVYGHNMESYCCINVLLEFGVKGPTITYIDPIPRSGFIDPYCHDKKVNDAIVAYLHEKEVTIYSDYCFVDWTMNPNQSNICSAKFQTRTKYIDIQCDALFFYGNKDVSVQTFSALNNASLVYNGRLVINTTFQTNDAYIFAGGSLTKYAGRLYADKYNHCYYNAVEVGGKMAQEMLKIWDPTVEPTRRGETLDNILPHTFTKPLVINCQLPGKINFLHVLKPGMIVPIQAIIQQESYGTIYVTGDCQGEHPSYFKLHLNSHRRVETIVCYTERKIDVNNMIRLYGKHERLLNNFVTRFESGGITDLYEYFSEPWCMLIFQDHFDQLENDIRSFLLSPTSCPDKNILADIYKACEENRCNKFMDEKYPELLDKFSKSVDKELVEEKLLQHIEDNCYHLTMYAYPKVIKLILYGHEDSPLHRY